MNKEFPIWFNYGHWGVVCLTETVEDKYFQIFGVTLNNEIIDSDYSNVNFHWFLTSRGAVVRKIVSDYFAGDQNCIFIISRKGLIELKEEFPALKALLPHTLR